MITDDKGSLPTGILGLFNTAGSLYVRRIGLYSVLALIALAVQYVVGVTLPHTIGLISGLQIIIDAFLVAAVSIGVAFDLAGKPADWSTVLLGASERWGAVALVTFILFLLTSYLAPVAVGPPADTGYYLFFIPVVMIWGAVSLAQVVAAIEPARNRWMQPLLALGKAWSVSFRAANVSRLIILSVLLALPFLAANEAYAQLVQRHVRDAVFWGNIPLDALLTGPLQALATVFYVDFLRRVKR